MEKEVKKFEPVVTEKKLFNARNIFLALLIGVILIIGTFLAIIFFEFSLTNSLLLTLIIVIFYAGVLFFLLEPGILKEVHTREVEYQRIQQPPIIKEIPKEVIKKVIVEKPVEKIVEKPIIRRVLVEAPRKKLNIPRYKYVGSSETKVYHKKSCRLGRSIKRSHKVSKNTTSYYKARGYKACKVCKPDKIKKK